MLIEFKVANFRSIRDEQTLSLVASNNDDDLAGCVIDRELPGLNGVRFLRGAAIYGANASGKSNLFKAVKYLGDLIENSATKLQPGESTGVEPFKLDAHSWDEPSKFEVTFVADGIRYTFGLLVTPVRMVEEYLVAYPKGSPQRWYSRKYNAETKSYRWERPASSFKYDKSLQEKTRENSLFLSVGPQFNHPQLTPVFQWFNSKVMFMHLAEGYIDLHFTAKMFTQSDYRARLLKLLRSADIGISAVEIQEKDIGLGNYFRSLSPVAMNEFEKRGMLDRSKEFRIQLTHDVDGNQPVALNFNKEESAGTRRFFL